MRQRTNPSDAFWAMATVTDLAELKSVAFRVTSDMGFTTFTVTTVCDRTDGDPVFAFMHNAPASYCPSHENREAGKRDPVMQHCKTSSLPIVWDQRTYTAAKMGGYWEEMAPHGYSTGITLALHLPRGRHICVGVDRAEALPPCVATVRRSAADLCLFATMIQEPASRLLMDDKAVPKPASLSKRELEALRWTMEGKTAWEVGNILGISEQTAARHLCNAARKLDCANKHHAVVKALRLGLIQ